MMRKKLNIMRIKEREGDILIGRAGANKRGVA